MCEEFRTLVARRGLHTLRCLEPAWPSWRLPSYMLDVSVTQILTVIRFDSGRVPDHMPAGFLY